MQPASQPQSIHGTAQAASLVFTNKLQTGRVSYYSVQSSHFTQWTPEDAVTLSHSLDTETGRRTGLSGRGGQWGVTGSHRGRLQRELDVDWARGCACRHEKQRFVDKWQRSIASCAQTLTPVCDSVLLIFNSISLIIIFRRCIKIGLLIWPWQSNIGRYQSHLLHTPTARKTDDLKLFDDILISYHWCKPHYNYTDHNKMYACTDNIMNIHMRSSFSTIVTFHYTLMWGCEKMLIVGSSVFIAIECVFMDPGDCWWQSAMASWLTDLSGGVSGVQFLPIVFTLLSWCVFVRDLSHRPTSLSVWMVASGRSICRLKYPHTWWFYLNFKHLC